MAKMRAAQVSRRGALEIVERDVPQPGPGTVRIKVEVCGVCHSDAVVVEGAWPGLVYPRIPGHEVIGIVDALGSGVTSVAMTACATHAVEGTSSVVVCRARPE
jgi:D-arabinose 1-dehydrogenase-like Zn-dependent alcohol dehydrogenase